MGEPTFKIMHAVNTIQLYKKVGGQARWGNAIYKIVGNVLVSECDYSWLNQYRWHLRAGGYARRMERINNQLTVTDFLMHREILGLPISPGHYGDVPDHKNHEPSDNTRENLRVADRGQSATYRRRRVGQAFAKGVSSVVHVMGTFKTFIVINGKKVFLGNGSEAECAYMYAVAAKLVQGDFAFYYEEDWVWLPEERRAELEARVKDIVTNPRDRNKRFITYDGRTQSIADWNREFGLPRNSLCRQLHYHGETVGMEKAHKLFLSRQSAVVHEAGFEDDGQELEWDHSQFGEEEW